VSIFGNTAVIGASRANADGAAYIFRFDGLSWVEEHKFFVQSGTTDEFGSSVAICGDTAVIGARCEDTDGEKSGAVYVYRYNGSNWVWQETLRPSDSESNKYFGERVGIWGDTIVVGAVGDNHSGQFSGSAYVFKFDGSDWFQQTKLLPSDSDDWDLFGCAADISGSTIVIGALDNDDNGPSSGSAYIFRYDGSTWSEKIKLLPDDGNEWDRFGNSAGICGDVTIIGAFEDADNGTDSGSAYLFAYDGSAWNQETKILPSDGEEDDTFGNRVSIWGDTTLVGARSDDDNGHDSGSAYVFGLSSNSGDVDLDSDVDFHDFNLLALYWLGIDCGPSRCERADITRDGSVTYSDLEKLADNWLREL